MASSPVNADITGPIGVQPSSGTNRKDWARRL